jgi:allantoinase
VLGFKCFLSPSGVPEFGHVSDADLDAAAPVLARLGLPLLAHAEDPAFLRAPAGDPRHYRTWLASRPEQAEVAAVRRLARLAARGSFPVHVVHVACGEVIDEARRLGAGGVPISLETCPHYLWFAAEDIPDAAPAFKCAPPIRQARHRSALWDALREGEVTIVASDHSPCPPALKAGADLIAAWGGIASLELGLAAVWTGARMRGFTPADLARWMSEAPARLAGLVDRKGAIAPGYDADLIAFDPAAERTVDPTRLQQRHPVTPYAGRALAGRVVRTWLRGEPVWDGEQVAAGPPRGRMLLRGMERAGAVR